MLEEIVCGIIIYKLVRRFIDADAADDDPAVFRGVDSSTSALLFSVASRLEKLYGGRCFVGLRIPDPDSSSRQHIDVVLLTRREIMIVKILNLSGFVDIDKTGNWVCVGDGNGKPELHSDPVMEITKQVENIMSYLEQRGATLPNNCFMGRVILPNPDCRVATSVSLHQEVVPYEKWNELKPDTLNEVSNWIKGTFQGNKSQIQDVVYEKIQYILSTSPMWDRLELQGDRNILGEFVEFSGSRGDMQLLKNLKRTKISQFIIQRSTVFGGFGRSKLQLVYCPRDYRSEGTSSSEWKEISVKPHSEILFLPFHSKKSRKFKLSSVVSLTLGP